MTSLLLIGDPHFKDGNDADTDPPVSFLLSFIPTRSWGAIIVLGDILHDHRRSYMRAHMKACDFLLALSKFAPTYLLIGNHDRMDNSDFLSDAHFFHGVASESLTIVSTVTVITIADRPVVLVPYVPAGRFREALLTYNDDPSWFQSAALICAHQEFNRCELAHNRYSTTGDDWTDISPPIYSGHIHGAHDYGSIHYVGSMYQVDYTEPPTKAVRAVTIHPSSLSEEIIPLPMRKKLLVTLTQDNFSSYSPPSDEEIPSVITIHIYCHPGVDLRHHPLVEQWIKRGYTVTQRVINDHSSSPPAITPSSTSFLAKFRDRVQAHPPYVAIIDRLFGAPPSPDG